MAAKKSWDTGLNSDRQVKVPGRNATRNVQRTGSSPWAVSWRRQNLVELDIWLVLCLQHYDKNTEVTWYFGSRKLTASHKYEINYANGVASIYVKDIEECDDGLYRCKVVTEEREDNTKILQRPPEFTLPLYNRTAYIGEDVRFGVTITVHPEPQVTWLKAGHRIKPDPAKYTFTSDKGLYQLMIHNVELVDDGEYTVVANNKFGEDSCKARLTVTPHPVVEDTMRPMFKRLLANIECVEGQSVQFDLRVSGTPPPTLKWEKDGKPLECRPQGNEFTLLLIEVFPEDAAQYTCEAKNDYGQASSSATLNVEGTITQSHECVYKNWTFTYHIV
uniref:Ig-like domain-containing protein n=1 Tax=Astyanax mexicanus TaxID=7994 RepID=A0A3B1IZD2_ASTMX